MSGDGNMAFNVSEKNIEDYKSHMYLGHMLYRQAMDSIKCNCTYDAKVKLLESKGHFISASKLIFWNQSAYEEVKNHIAQCDRMIESIEEKDRQV